VRSSRPSPDIQIRPRTAEDDAFIAELGKAAFGEYDTSAAMSSLSLARRGRTLLARDAKRSLGFVIVDPPSSGTAHLSAIAVVEDARGRGVGSALVLAAELRATRDGANRIELTTADSNLPTLELFLRSGYVRTARVGAYARGQRSVGLVKTL
jgi:ribosomal protein S18 acetylase RimI-like enzyme